MDEVRVRLGYTPTMRQRLFHASTADEALLGRPPAGGRRRPW